MNEDLFYCCVNVAGVNINSLCFLSLELLVVKQRSLWSWLNVPARVLVVGFCLFAQFQTSVCDKVTKTNWQKVLCQKNKHIPFVVCFWKEVITLYDKPRPTTSWITWITHTWFSLSDVWKPAQSFLHWAVCGFDAVAVSNRALFVSIHLG